MQVFFLWKKKNLQNSCAIFSCASLVGSCYFILFYFTANGRIPLHMNSVDYDERLVSEMTDYLNFAPLTHSL